MTSNYSEIIKGLFVTNWYGASDPSLLLLNNIKAIITIEKSSRNPEFYQFIKENGIIILKIPLDDTPYSLIHLSFDITYDFIKEHLKRGNVVVHCMAGVSRSPTIVANYMLRELYANGFPAEEEQAVGIVLDLIRFRRPEINPNHGFINQLVCQARKYRQNYN